MIQQATHRSDAPTIQLLKVGLRRATVSDKVFVYLLLVLMGCRD